MKRSKSNRVISKPTETDDELEKRLLKGLEELTQEERKQVIYRMGDGASFTDAVKMVKSLRV